MADTSEAVPVWLLYPCPRTVHVCRNLCLFPWTQNPRIAEVGRVVALARVRNFYFGMALCAVI